jgi:tetratricopeptide (TPR) repeat protein
MGTLLQCIRSSFRHRAVRWGIVALIVASAGIGWSLHRERTIDSRRGEAEAALDRLDLIGAAEHLRAVLTIHPDEADTHLLLASTLRRNGDFEPAKQHLDEAKRLGCDVAAARRELFLLELQSTGIVDRSGQELMGLVRGRAPDRATLEALYRGDLAIKNWDRAGLWLHLWLENNPDDWPPRLWQAELLERFKKYDAARADYVRVLQLRPDCPRALLGVGMCALENRADYLEAEEFLGRYLTHDPEHAEAGVGLARCRLGRGDLAGSRALTAAVLRSHPNHAGAALLLGTLEMEAGNDEEALVWLSAAERCGADVVSVNYQLAQLLRRTGRTAEAEAASDRFRSRRDLLRAVEEASRSAEREPGNSGNHFEVGRLYLTMNEPELAKQWFMRAVRQDPNHRASHAALADYYARESGAGAKARAEFHRLRSQEVESKSRP